MDKPYLFKATVVDMEAMVNEYNHDISKMVTAEALGSCIYCKSGAGYRAYFSYTTNQEIIEIYDFKLCHSCYDSQIASRELINLKHVIPLFKMKETDDLNLISLGWSEYHADKLQGEMGNIARDTIFSVGED